MVGISADELFKEIQSKIPLLILDIRAKQAYMDGHIKGSANAICSSMQQKQIIMSKIPRTFKIILVDEDGSESSENATLMQKFGFNAYHLEGGMKSWNKEIMKSEQETVISNEDLWNKLDKKEDVFLLDVREPQEFAEFKIDGAVNVPLSRLFSKETIQDIPTDKKIITICSHGNRSMVATFALAQKGLESTSLEGGMSRWNQVLNSRIIAKEENFIILQVEKIGKGCLSYILGSDGEAIVIDPTYPASKYLDFTTKEGLTIKKVLDTHQHADHVSAARELAKLAKAELFLSSKEVYELENTKVADGDLIQFGKKSLRAIHTPGHTAGSMTFVADEKYVFCGDTLFIEGIGRPDLRDKAQEFARDLYNTLHKRILSLNSSAKIYPAHHGEGVKPTENGIYYTTVDQAKKLPLLDLDEKQFVNKITSIITPRPMNYSMIIKVNKGVIPIMTEQIPDLEMGPNRCSVRSN